MKHTHLLTSPGSRSALVNMEAKSEDASMLNRKCVVVLWKELTSEGFQDMIHRGAGAILVLLPHLNHTLEKEVQEVRARWGRVRQPWGVRWAGVFCEGVGECYVLVWCPLGVAGSGT